MVATALAGLAAGCGGKEAPAAPLVSDAKPFADDFVQRLVVDGRWSAVRDDVSPQLSLELRNFQRKIRSDGIRHASSGALRHDCPAAPSVDAGRDCFRYRLRGKQVVPISGVIPLVADYRLWVDYEDGRWQVINYDYTLLSR